MNQDEVALSKSRLQYSGVEYLASIEQVLRSGDERLDVSFNDRHWEQGLAAVNGSNVWYLLIVNHLLDIIARVANGKLIRDPVCWEVNDVSLGILRKRVSEASYELMVGAADSDGRYIIAAP